MTLDNSAGEVLPLDASVLGLLCHCAAQRLQAQIHAVILEIRPSGERIGGRLVTDERRKRLCVTFGEYGRVRYALDGVLQIGWRIIECTPNELELMKAHRIYFGHTLGVCT